ncbi:MAG: translation initiation factor IF-1 [Patescibacteria group bacterium]|nr:translation initiation factor IF-1 [Patescibacteria group bacterium]
MNQTKLKETITQEGVVIETLPSLTFKVKLDDESEIIAKLSGKMRLHHIRVLIGDQVRVEMTPYDLTKGRIVYRGK